MKYILCSDCNVCGETNKLNRTEHRLSSYRKLLWERKIPWIKRQYNISIQNLNPKTDHPQTNIQYRVAKKCQLLLLSVLFNNQWNISFSEQNFSEMSLLELCYIKCLCVCVLRMGESNFLSSIPLKTFTTDIYTYSSAQSRFKRLLFCHVEFSSALEFQLFKNNSLRQKCGRNSAVEAFKLVFKCYKQKCGIEDLCRVWCIH